jgi:heat-inducible transcriptional repressor
MTERQARLLAAIINEYVRTGELISSGLLAKKYKLGIRPASIRNEMMELEEAGFLLQPHTSAGRMPTDRAFRHFVDKIIETELCNADDGCKRIIDDAIHSAGREPRHINRALAETLSELSDNLVITNIIEQNEFYKTGFSSLFEFPEFRELDRMFNLASFFDEFENVFNRMAGEFFGESDFNLFIGRENINRKMQDETVMVAKYKLPRDLTGSVTMVGPIRMDYGRNIGLVRYATDEINKLSKNI